VQFHPEVDGDIVAAWSERCLTRVQLAAEFAEAEQTHRALARQLLKNYLKMAGFFG
jgi:GMP synthase-like glutamine amidotransferase